MHYSAVMVVHALLHSLGFRPRIWAWIYSPGLGYIHHNRWSSIVVIVAGLVIPFNMVRPWRRSMSSWSTRELPPSGLLIEAAISHCTLYRNTDSKSRRRLCAFGNG